MCKKKICFYVGTDDAVDSNLFLRKFYELMSHVCKVAWQFKGYRLKDKIHIGTVTFGDVWIDYKERGKINNIYVYSDNKEIVPIIVQNLKKAKDTFKDSFVDYTVSLSIKYNEVVFQEQAYNNIAVYFDKKKHENIIKFKIKAFGDFDYEYVVTQKINYIKHLLCAYTNIIFDIEIINVETGGFDCVDQIDGSIDSDWIENRELLSQDDKLILPVDFFKFFFVVLNTEQYERKLRLVLNSVQQLYCANLMKDDVVKNGIHLIPGYVDIINTTLISALEPLTNINGPKAEVCIECGQIKYSIRKRVRDLCSKYLPPWLTKYIDDLYKDRSSFLHEGNAKTNEFYCGHSVPLLNPVDGRSIMLPLSYINFNLFEYVSYVIRKVIADEF